jgi:hypothetical protein
MDNVGIFCGRLVFFTPFGVFNEHLVDFMDFFPSLVFCSTKNLATLNYSRILSIDYTTF